MRFHKFISVASLIFLLLFGLVVVSAWSVRHAIRGGQRFSEGVRNSILAIAEFPVKAKSVLNLFGNYFPPKGVPSVYSDYSVVHKSTNAITGFLLVSCISSNGMNSVLLLNISNKTSRKINLNGDNLKVKSYSDFLVGSEPRRQSVFSSRGRIWHPHLTKEGVLTFAMPWNDLTSIDLKTGKQRWVIRGAFHHSIEVDTDGNLWACGAVQPNAIKNLNPRMRQSNESFEDQALVKVSTSGKILEVISVADLLVMSQLENVLYGVSNPNDILDPLHLNQITPILTDSGLFRKGQVLVSLRNISKILLVDPVAKSIIWEGGGGWMNQHCVVPIGPSRFSILDNHSFASGEYWLDPGWRTRVVEHNVETGSTTEIRFNKYSPREFHIPIEGRALPIGVDAWLIEDSVAGTIMIFRNGQLVYKWSNDYADGKVGVVSWCRYLPDDMVPDFLFNN
jgi:hypothetical protein